MGNKVLYPSTHPASQNVELYTDGAYQNLSFVLESPGKVKFEDRAVPELKSPYDVIVEVKYTGICGSDVCFPFSEKLPFRPARLVYLTMKRHPGSLLARRQDRLLHRQSTNGPRP